MSGGLEELLGSKEETSILTRAQLVGIDLDEARRMGGQWHPRSLWGSRVYGLEGLEL